MKSKIWIGMVTLSLASALSCAQQIESVPPKTRAQVNAEIAKARADGTLDVRDDEYPIAAKNGTSKTRAEVVSGIARARADGSLDINDSTYPMQPATAASKTRSEVKRERDAAISDRSLAAESRTLYRD
jgi:hypothetical protein